MEAFDQETMLEMTRVVSAEGAALVEAQTSALFGDLKLLQRQMQVHCPLQKLAQLRPRYDTQKDAVPATLLNAAKLQEAVGTDANSMEELMERVQSAVNSGAVESVTITVGTQRRAVLEAVAFGTFLRDVETHVDTEYALLTPPSVDGGSGGGGQGARKGGSPLAGV